MTGNIRNTKKRREDIDTNTTRRGVLAWKRNPLSAVESVQDVYVRKIVGSVTLAGNEGTIDKAII